MSFPSYNDLSRFDASQGDEIQQFISYLQGFLSAQHKDDGSHSAITADSITVTGDVSIGGAENVTGAGNFGGDVVSLFKSGNECGIGTLATINGVTLEGSEALRTGLLLGGIAHGVWIEQRLAGSPFNSNYELRVWLLDWDSTTAALRFGITSGRPTLMDGGTGSTAIDIGSSSRYFNNVFAQKFFRSDSSAAQGEWTNVTFNAGNFTGGGSQTWTVISGNQTTFRYAVVGKTITVAFTIVSTTVGGTPNPQLRIAIPGGYVANQDMRNPIQVSDNGNAHAGLAQVAASGTVINLFTDMSAGTNWAASTTNTVVAGQITFEVQ